MNCRSARKAALFAVDGELSADKQLALDEHIRACPECDGFYTRLRDEAELLTWALDAQPAIDQGLLSQPTSEVVSGVRSALPTIESDPPTREPRVALPVPARRRLAWGLAAAVVVVLAVAASLFINRPNRPAGTEPNTSQVADSAPGALVLAALFR